MQYAWNRVEKLTDKQNVFYKTLIYIILSINRRYRMRVMRTEKKENKYSIGYMLICECVKIWSLMLQVFYKKPFYIIVAKLF